MIKSYTAPVLFCRRLRSKGSWMAWRTKAVDCQRTNTAAAVSGSAGGTGDTHTTRQAYALCRTLPAAALYVDG